MSILQLVRLFQREQNWNRMVIIGPTGTGKTNTIIHYITTMISVPNVWRNIYSVECLRRVLMEDIKRFHPTSWSLTVYSKCLCCETRLSQLLSFNRSSQMGYISDFHPIQNWLIVSTALVFNIISWFNCALYHPVTIRMNRMLLWNGIYHRSSFIGRRGSSIWPPPVLSPKRSANRIVIVIEENAK